MARNTCGLHINSSDGVCYTLSELKSIAKAYNDNHSDKININLSRRNLVTSISNRLNTKCGDDQMCWSQSQNLSINAFKLNIHRYEKLCSKTIDDAMNQIEKKYKNFLFLNAVPSDIYKHHIFEEYIKHHNRLKPMTAVILNTLPANTSGEHWVVVFIDKKNQTVEYFDPLADMPNSDIQKSISYIRDRFNLSSYEFFINTKQHQSRDDDINCGIYCMTYILERLEGRNFYDISNKLLKADRNRFFSLIH